MNRLLLALVGLVAAGAAFYWTRTSGAQVAVDSTTLSFRPFAEFEATGIGRPDILIDGWRIEKPPKGAFPAAFWANDACSATLVGEETLLTAAHCFGTARFVNIRVAGRVVDGECQTARDVSSGASTADFALCRMLEKIRGVVFETVNTHAGPVKKDDEVLLTGLGENPFYKPGKRVVIGTTRVRDVMAQEVRTVGGAWIRDGDSGGAGYAPLGDHRRMISVSARSNPNKETSVVTVLGAVRSVIDDWQKSQRQAGHQVLICGIDPAASSCHQ
jgi:hypothetical protein